MQSDSSTYTYTPVPAHAAGGSPYLTIINNGAFAVVITSAFLGVWAWRSLIKPLFRFTADYLQSQQKISDHQSEAIDALKDGLKEMNILHIGALDRLGAALEKRDVGLDAQLGQLAQGQRELKEMIARERSPKRRPWH